MLPGHTVRSSTTQFKNTQVPRFRHLDNEYTKMLEELLKKYSFLKNRLEYHIPFSKTKQIFSQETSWVWPKFDKRPYSYLIFADSFAPCIWNPTKHEGFTLRYLVPSNMFLKGPTVCIVSILAGESMIQIEDVIVHEGREIWKSERFSKRWNTLKEFWEKIPSVQPFVKIGVRIVEPISLEDWESNYDPDIYWIIQPDNAGVTRWFWKDVVSSTCKITLKQSSNNLIKPCVTLCGLCRPYTKINLPDTYELCSQEGEYIGIASIVNMNISTVLRKNFESPGQKNKGIPVELVWNNDFKKYQIMKMMPENSLISPMSYFTNTDETIYDE